MEVPLAGASPRCSVQAAACGARRRPSAAVGCRPHYLSSSSGCVALACIWPPPPSPAPAPAAHRFIVAAARRRCRTPLLPLDRRRPMPPRAASAKTNPLAPSLNRRPCARRCAAPLAAQPPGARPQPPPSAAAPLSRGRAGPSPSSSSSSSSRLAATIGGAGGGLPAAPAIDATGVAMRSAERVRRLTVLLELRKVYRNCLRGESLLGCASPVYVKPERGARRAGAGAAAAAAAAARQQRGSGRRPLRARRFRTTGRRRRRLSAARLSLPLLLDSPSSLSLFTLPAGVPGG